LKEKFANKKGKIVSFCKSSSLHFDSKEFYVTGINVKHLFCFSLYLEKSRSKMAYSKNANVNLKQSDLSHFVSDLAYH